MIARQEPPEWYFFKAGSLAGEKTGPFSWERLRLQAERGILERTDVVWDPGSGWQIAAQIPGLFPTVASPAVAGCYSETPPPDPSSPAHWRSWLPWLVPLVALVIIGAALGLYFGLTNGGGEGSGGDETSTTVIASATAQSTTTVPETSAVGDPPAVSLDKGDFGNVVVLSVGERARIDLTPWAGDKVRSVRWDYVPISVRETDSGMEMISGVVVGCWLELEAVVAGPVTVRAEYEYPDGSAKAIWVVYLRVRE